MNNSPIKCSIPKVKLSFSKAESGENDMSLTQAINNYREANRRLNELPNTENAAQEDAAVKWTYQRPMDVLCA